jgi:L-Ala-D/L-Glu epimerase
MLLMSLKIHADAQTFPIAGAFTISRGSKTEAMVVVARISDGIITGTGECVPYARYGESVGSVLAEIEGASAPLAAKPDRHALALMLKPGAARNALDCALWDYEAKRARKSVREVLGVSEPKPLITAYTLSLGTAEEMGNAAKASSHRALLKIKVGGQGDIDRLRAVALNAPKSKIILDANEGWTDENIIQNMAAAAELGVALIEQPLPAGSDAILAKISHPVPVCADESAHTSEGLAALRDRYDAVNIKLDKTGGLTEALQMRDEARKLGFQIMVGCMVGSSLAMAPAVLLAQDADFVDLDGPLLLARDREPALKYEGSLVYPPDPGLWG